MADVHTIIPDNDMKFLLNYLYVNRIDMTKFIRSMIDESMKKFGVKSKQYSFDTYPINEENLKIVRQRILDKFGTLAEYSRYSGVNRDFIYSIFNSKRKPALKTWTELSYDAGFVKYNQKEQQTA